MQMSLSNDSEWSVDFSYGSDNFYIAQVFGISRNFYRCSDSEIVSISDTELYLCRLPIWSNYSHLFYLALLTDEGNELFSSILSWLSNSLEDFEFVAFAKKLFTIAL